MQPGEPLASISGCGVPHLTKKGQPACCGNDWRLALTACGALRLLTTL